MKINGKISSRNKMYNLNQNNRRLNNLRCLVKDQILLLLIDGLDLMIICNVGMSYVCFIYVLCMSYVCLTFMYADIYL